MRSRRQWWPYAVLLAEILLFYRRVLFSAGYAIPWDLRYYHFPIASFVARSLRQGELPLWDPYAYCGMPLFANMQTQLFYPPTLAAILLSNWLAPQHLLYFVELQLIAHVLLAGVFTYWLLRNLDMDALPAATGATVFQLGAFFASQTQHLGAIDAAAWLPLALLAVVRMRPTFNLRWLAVLAFSLSMSILAGFPAVTLVVFGATLLLAILLILFRDASPKLALHTLAAFAWATLLATIQLLPTLELTRRSVAQYRSDYLGAGGGMPIQSLVSLILPNHYSVFDLGHYSLPFNVTFLYTYCGIVGLALALIGATRRSRASYVFLITALLSAVAMLGAATPIGQAAFLALPRILRAAIYPEYALALFTLAVAVLAALGAQRSSRVFAGVLLAATALDLIAVSSNRPMNTTSTQAEPGISHDTFDGNREVLDRMRALVNQTTPPSRIDTVDDSLNWASAAALFEIPGANGNDPFALARYIQVRLSFVANGARWGRYYQVSNPKSPVLDLLNVRYLLSHAPVPGLAPSAEIPGHLVFENPHALPRFFLTDHIQLAADMDQALAVLRSPSFQPREVAVVEDGTEGAAQIAGASRTIAPPVRIVTTAAFGNPRAGANPPVRVLHYAPRHVVLQTDTLQPSFLVTSEAYYPGWRAYLDGREQPLLLTNVAFRGMSVPAGRHFIEMRFNPPILWRGAAVTTLALLALISVAASAIIKRRSWTS